MQIVRADITPGMTPEQITGAIEAAVLCALDTITADKRARARIHLGLVTRLVAVMCERTSGATVAQMLRGWADALEADAQTRKGKPN